MGNTHAPTPAPAPAPATQTTTTPAAPGAPNAQAEQQAEAGRRGARWSALAPHPHWMGLLGDLIPPNTPGGPVLATLVAPPDVAAFRKSAFALEMSGITGRAEAEAYLVEADAPQTIVTAVREIGARAPGDRTNAASIRQLIAWLGGGGDIAIGSIRIVSMVALMSEDGKKWLPDQTAMINALTVQANLSARDAERARTLRGLVQTIRHPTLVGAMHHENARPVPTPAQLGIAHTLIGAIIGLFPPEAAPAADASLADQRRARATSRTADQAKVEAALAMIRGAEPVVREYMYAWRTTDGKGLFDIIGGQLSPGQVEAVNSALDPLETLLRDLQVSVGQLPPPQGTQPAVRRSAFQILYDFVAGHAGDEPTRLRLRDHAPIMQGFVQMLPGEQNRRIMRMIVSGRDEADAVEKLYEAASQGSAQMALQAIVELGAQPQRLQQLRADHLFLHRLQQVNQAVSWNGIEIKPYDLFLQMCGINPFEIREPGAVARQHEVNPNANSLPLNLEERCQLDRELYEPHVGRLVEILNGFWGVNDSDTLECLRAFQACAARPHIVELLRRANEPPGITLANRVQARGTNVRTKIRNGLDDDNIPEAERILGMATDQAAVGTIGGRGTLATDNQVQNGQGRIPLEQALRETQVDGMVLSRYIHGRARDLANELDESWINGWAEEDDVRAIWTSYTAVVNEAVCNDLRQKTGLPRVWAIELLSNAFLQVGGGSLEQKLNDGLSDDERGVIREMGMTPGQSETRRQMAQQNMAQTAANEAAAEAQIAAQAQAMVFDQPAKELFGALAGLRPTSQDAHFQNAGRRLQTGLAMAGINAPATIAAPARGADPGARPGGPAATGAVVPTSFRAYYQRHHGIDPTRHAVEVARAMGTRERTPAQVGQLLGVTAAELEAAVVAPTEDGFAITETNRTLIGPDFTLPEAERRAQAMWDHLHGEGQIQLIRNELDGRTAEEQRLIHIAFRRLSGGIDLRFYLLQARHQQQTQGGWHVFGGVGGGGVAGDQRALHVAGRQSEIDLLLDVTQNGRVSIAQRLRSAIGGGNMNEVYSLLEAASADDRREILASAPLMGELRGFADDAHEWSRVHRTLTGEVDMFDRLESRAHGAGGFWGFLDATDEKGMETDIRNYVRTRRRAIRIEVEQRGASQQPPMTQEQVNQATEEQLRAEMNLMAHNPSIRAILNDELSGTELSVREGLILNAGQDSLVAYTLTEGDWTEDEERIIADIKQMPLEERRRRRNDPEFLRRLQAAIQSQTTWADAMAALNSEAEPGVEDNLAELSRASRTYRQDQSELNVDEDEVIEYLSKLTQPEYARLMADPRLQAQILSSLDDNPTHLARARELMAYRNSDAAAETGLAVATADRAPDLGAGVLPADEVQRLGYVKWRAVQQVTSGANRSWGKLLEAALDVFKADFKPRSPAPAAPAEPTTGPAPAPAPAATTPTAPTAEQVQEERLRGQVWSEVTTIVTGSTEGWGRMGDRTKVNASQQNGIIENAIKKQADPSNYLLDVATGVFDDEDRIKQTLRTASDQVLIDEWTTVAQVSPSGGGSMRAAYQRWARERGRPPGPDQPRRRPRVGSPEWEARTAFQTFVIDTSRPFEDRLIHAAGGIFSDTAATGDGERRTRDNAEWLEWRTIIRDRIPTLDKDKIARAIGADRDTEAIGLIRNGTRDALTQLSYDEEGYLVDRGENSNYNMDRLTAGGEGQRMDSSMADYRREVLTGVIADPENAQAGETYGEITDDERDRIGEARERYNQSRSEFRAAKEAVANVAAMIVAIVITAVVTILTAGTATGPVAVMLIGALTAGTASLGANATREAVQGTSFEFTNEGLTNIARDTIMGAVTAGSIYYAGRMTNALFGLRAAQTQAQAMQGVLRQKPPFLVELMKEGTEEAFEETLGGLFEAGVAPFDPALWHEGFSEGWLRGSRLARDRAAQIPGDAMRAAVTSVLTRTMTHGASAAYGAARNRLRGGAPDLPDVPDAPDTPDAPPQHAAFGNRAPIGVRTRQVLGQMFDSLGDGSVQGSAGILLDETTWRAEGQEFGRIMGGAGMAALTQMKEAAQSLHVSDALVVQRARAGATQLALHGGQLSSHERQLYSQLVMVGETASVISVDSFVQIRSQTINEGVARHQAQTGRALTQAERRAFDQYVREATSVEEFHRRAEESPSTIPAVQAATARQGQAQVMAQERAAQELIAREQSDPSTPAQSLITQLEGQQAAMVEHRTQSDELRARASVLFEQVLADLQLVPAGSLLHDQAMRLRAELTALHQTIGQNTQTTLLATGTMGIVPLDLRVELARQGQQDTPENAAARRQALYDAVIAARVKLETLPGQAAESVAATRAAIERLEDLAIRAQATAQVAARSNAATAATSDLPPATTAPPADAPPPAPAPVVDTPPPTQVAQGPTQTQTQGPPAPDGVDRISTENATPAEMQRLQQLTQQHGEVQGHELWLEWRQAQAELRRAGIDGDVASTGTASTMANSTFHGQHQGPPITQEDVTAGLTRVAQNIENVIQGRGATAALDGTHITVEGSTISVKLPDGTTRRVVVQIATEAQAEVATFATSDNAGVISVSPQARTLDLERGLAHELAEMLTIWTRPAGPRAPGATPEISPHHVGRVVELRVMLDQLQSMVESNTTQGATATLAEIRAVLADLGLPAPIDGHIDQRLADALGPQVASQMRDVFSPQRISRLDPGHYQHADVAALGTGFAGFATTPDAQRTNAAIDSSLATLAPGSRGRFVEIARDGMTAPFVVEVRAQSTDPSLVVAGVTSVQLDPDGNRATILVSDAATPDAIERAVAARLAEMRHVVAQRAGGQRVDTTSALAEGSQATVLSPSDHGKIAELRVIARQIAAAQAAGDSARAAQLQRDMLSQVVAMGLVETAPSAPLHQAPNARPEDARVVGEDASRRRVALIQAALGPDYATIQTTIDSARDPVNAAAIADVRGDRAAARERLRQAAQEMVERHRQRNALLNAAVDARIGPDGKGRVFERLIVGGGWAATADFATLGVGDQGQVPSVMAIASGPDPWSQRGDLRMGQNANELEVQGFAVQPADLAPDLDDFTRSSDFALAVGASAAAARMPVYNGQVTSIEPRPDNATDWPERARYKLTVNGRTFYAESVDVVSGPGPARVSRVAPRIEHPSGYSIDTFTGRWFGPDGSQVIGSHVPAAIRADLLRARAHQSDTFVDPESGYSVKQLSNGRELVRDRDGNEVDPASLPRDVQSRLGVRPGQSGSTPNLVDASTGRVASTRVLDAESGYAVDTVTGHVIDPQGELVTPSQVPPAIRTRLGFDAAGNFRDPRFVAHPSGLSINPQTGEIIRTTSGERVDPSTLDADQRRALDDLARARRGVSFGGERTADGFTDGEQVLVYGAGASGAWDVEQAHAGGAQVDWSGRMQIPPASMFPAGSDERAMLEELHDPATPYTRRAQLQDRLRDVIIDHSFREGRNRRNTLPGVGALSPEVLSDVTRDTREIVDIQPTTDGRYFVRFNNGTSGIYHRIVMSIGQDAMGPTGVGQLTQGVPLEPIRGPGGEVLGAQDATGGLRVLGAAGVTGPIVGDFDQDTREQMREQAGQLPGDSRNIAPSIRNQGRRIGTANEPDMGPKGPDGDARTLTTSVDTIADRYADRLATVDTELTRAPTGTRALDVSASDALIGLPTDVISPTGKADDAIAQLQQEGIPRWPGLTAGEREHETAFADEVEANLPQIVEQFYASSNDAKLGTYVFEVDAAKKLYGPYGKDKAPKDQAELDVRATANHALHPTAVAIARLAFLRRLDELKALPPDDPRRSLFVTNGGCAAGKGSLGELVKSQRGNFDFGAVWDAAGEGDAQENGWILQAAQERGLHVVYGFVENDPMLTYNSVLNRADLSGRIVDPVTFARSYVRGQQNMADFLSSPEYLAAEQAGTVETLGLYTGRFDTRSLSEPDTYSPYPDSRLLGDNGRITAEDISAPKDEAQVTATALDQFDAWMAQRDRDGKQSDHWFEGGIANTLKFGQLGGTTETPDSDVAPVRTSDEANRERWEQTPKAERLWHPPLPEASREQLRQDVITERLAHGLAYRDADAFTEEDSTYLTEQGLQVGQVIHGVGGLELTTFVPVDGSNATPVLAFRGTKGKADLIDDVNPRGIGAYQMAANEGVIATTLASLQGYGGPPTITGHSLGGALAQMTAVRFPDLVGRVVTFQSPGISKEMVAQLDDYNRKAEAEGRPTVESSHYSAQGDLIPLAGEAFTSGFATVIHRGTDIMKELPTEGIFHLFDEHTAYPLDEFVKSGEGLTSWPVGGDRLAGRGPASAYEGTPNSFPRLYNAVRKFAEAVRVGAGRVVELFERLGNFGSSPRNNYQRVWDDVRAAVDRGDDPEVIVTIIEGSNVREEDKNLMIDNLRAIVAAQAGSN